MQPARYTQPHKIPHRSTSDAVASHYAPHDADRLPSAHVPSPSIGEQPAAEPSPPILVVEDDAAVQTMLFMALEDAGYAVEMASNGADALEQMKTIRPRLLLVDMRMPVMDGPTFLRQLYAQQEYPIPPIIVMTAYREVDPTALELGLPSISKPMNIPQLLKLVEQHALDE